MTIFEVLVDEICHKDLYQMYYWVNMKDLQKVEQHNFVRSQGSSSSSLEGIYSSLTLIKQPVKNALLFLYGTKEQIVSIYRN